MPDRYQSLTQRERETLRLILHGHDAKSMADELGLSVHTVNEYLRNARRKLGVTSSKEAARRLFKEESDGPHFLGHKTLGDVSKGEPEQSHKQPQGGYIPRKSRVSIIGGLLIMSIIFAALALALIPDHANTAQDASVSAEAQNSAIEAAARQWLEWNDAGDWQTTYDSTAASFREANTAELWAQVSEEVRPPLGATISRTLEAVETPPTPENYRLVKFQTRFANREETATETVTLVNEDGAWKVVGIYID